MVRTYMANELCENILKIRATNPLSTIILLGDFNFGKIKWEFTDDTPNHLTPKVCEYPRIENNFIRVTATLLLRQINHLTNFKGKWLDLTFTDEVEHSNCRSPHATEYIDKCSVHHNPYVVDVAFANVAETNEKVVNHWNVNKARFRQAIQTHAAQLLANIENSFERHSNSPRTIVNDASSQFIENISTLQHECTKLAFAHKPTLSNVHPWANTKQYSKLRKLIVRDIAKTAYRKNQTPVNKGALDSANAQMYAMYNELTDIMGTSSHKWEGPGRIFTRS